MERVEVLIDKLKQQFLENAGPEQLLVTVQLLQGELITRSSGNESRQAKKSVSVIVPSSIKMHSSVQSSQPVIKPVELKPVKESQVEMLEVDEANVRAELEQVKKTVEQHSTWSYNARQMAVVEEEQEMDIPTLASHHSFQPISKPAPPAKKPELKQEVNETIISSESSLNERLKEEKTELAEKLKDTPVKDLKKAVGINDRYLYIIELFSGNESMFDRSIKTLNSFSILPEAEFWMERELKLKLGWNENNPLVQQFIQLVRRRFS